MLHLLTEVLEPQSPPLLKNRSHFPRGQSQKLCICQHYSQYLTEGVLHNPLHLLMDELHTSETGLLESTYLSLDQKLKWNLRDKQGRPRTLWAETTKNSDLREIHILVISSKCDLISYRCVSNGRQYIFCGKSFQGIHVLKCLTKDVVKNVTYPRSSTTVLVNKTKIKLDSFSLGLFI